MENNKNKIIEHPSVTLSDDKEILTVHNYVNTKGKIVLDKSEASLLMIELWKFINDSKQQENIDVDYFHSVIKKLPHSEGRVPYTYHHDYLRINVDKFKDSSRSYVATNHSDNDIELYAVALTQLLDEIHFRDTMYLNSDDIVVCKKAIEITENVINRYKS